MATLLVSVSRTRGGGGVDREIVDLCRQALKAGSATAATMSMASRTASAINHLSAGTMPSRADCGGERVAMPLGTSVVGVAPLGWSGGRPIIRRAAAGSYDIQVAFRWRAPESHVGGLTS